MIIAFWIAVGLCLLWVALSATASLHMDSWGEKVLPAAQIALLAAALAIAVFVGWFALNSIGVHITYGGS